MSSPLLALTRRRKIAILISLVSFLFIVAAISTYLDENPNHQHQDYSDNLESRSLRLRSRKRNSDYHQERSDSGVSSHQQSHERPHKKHSDHQREDSGHEDHKKSHGLNKGHRKIKPTKTSKHQKETKNQPGSAISVKMAAKNDDKFDANRILQQFSSCRKPDDELLIDCYVDSYEELCKLFKAFGTVFGFVSSDVVEKIGILRDYRKTPEAEHYATIQSMLSYEVEKEITNNKKKASGSRTLLRLHRALEFIEALLVKIKDTDNKDKFSTVACKAYDDTLAKHHPWLIKKAVHVAMYVLPSRLELLNKMQLEDSENGMVALSKLIDELNVIFKITQDLYAKDKLLDLP